MSGPCYLDIPTCRAFAGLGTDTSADAVLKILAAGVEQAVKTHLGYDPLYQTRTDEYHSPNGGTVLYLTCPWVESVTSVYEDRTGRYGANPDGAFGADTLLTAGTDYVLAVEGGHRTGRLIRLGALWPFDRSRGPYGDRLATSYGPLAGAVKVTYVAGFTPDAVPADVLGAMYAEVAARYAARGGVTGPLSSESLDGWSRSFAGAGDVLGSGQASRPFLTAGLKAALAPYRVVPIGRTTGV